MEPRLAQRVAVVTGGARNIGRAIGERLAAEGARVALADIEDSVTETAAAISAAGGEAAGYRADVSSATDVDTLFDDVLGRFGTVDILVNNAAKLAGAVRHFLETDEEWWNGIVDVNLKGSYLCARRAAPIMARQGRGVIVNMSSGGGSRAHRGMTAYDASKGGKEALTRALALDLGHYGVRVITVVPGLIFQQGQTDEAVAKAAATTPLERMGKPEDIASAVAFAVSDDASYITGSSIVVDGGVLAQQRSPQVDTFPVSGFPSRPE
jgi:3-oxoacyl-[acyl-carrier protein] reductase